MTFLKTLALVSLLAVAAYAVDEEPPPPGANGEPPMPKKPTTPPPGAKTEGDGEEKPPAEGEKTEMMMKCPDMKGFKFKGTMDAGMGVWYDGKFDPKMEEMTGDNKKKDGEEEKEKKGGRKLLGDDDDEKEGGEEVDMEGLIPKTEFMTIEDFTITIMEQEGEDKCFLFGSVEYFDKARDEDVVQWWSGIVGASATETEMMLIGKTGRAIGYTRFSPDMKEMFVTSHTLGLPRSIKEEIMPQIKEKMEDGDKKGEMMSKMWMLKDSFFMLHRGHLMMVEE